MNIKEYIPNTKLFVQVLVITVVLAITGIGAAAIAKTRGLMGRVK